jgi:hypothetical protein
MMHNNLHHAILMLISVYIALSSAEESHFCNKVTKEREMRECPYSRGHLTYSMTEEHSPTEWNLDLETLQRESILGYNHVMNLDEITSEVRSRIASHLKCPHVR